MIIVYGEIKNQWEWFDDDDPDSIADKWRYLTCGDDETYDTLFLTSKTKQFVLEKTLGNYHKKWFKITKTSALIWLMEHQFIIPNMFRHHFTEDNRIQCI